MIDEYGLHWTDVNWIAGPNQRFAPCDEAAEKTFEGDLERLRSYRAAMNAIGLQPTRNAAGGSTTG